MVNWTAGDTAVMMVWLSIFVVPIVGAHVLYLRAKLETLRHERAKIGTLHAMTKRRR
jgi:hypothetical protein